MAGSIKKAFAVHSIIITIVVTTKEELQHHHHTTRVSTKKERKEWERIKVTKIEKKEAED